MSCIHKGRFISFVKVTCTKKKNQARMKDVFECNIHNRCIPKFKGPWHPDQELESKLYKLCSECEEYVKRHG